MPKPPFLKVFLRLYENVPSDAIIIKGLEQITGHGAKPIEIKRILLEYFNTGIKHVERRKNKGNGAGLSVNTQSPVVSASSVSSSSPVSLDVSEMEGDCLIEPETAEEKKKRKLNKLFSAY